MIWSFVAELCLFVGSGFIIMVYGIYVLQMRQTREAGILTINVRPNPPLWIRLMHFSLTFLPYPGGPT